MLFNPAANRFVDNVDEPATVYYRDDRENSDVGNKENGDIQTTPCEDNRRADGFRRRATRR